ncbi:MAG: amino acid adenylation domain-containing protein [Cyanobacteria bacterium J06635_15]
MKAENIQDIYELSPAQQGILFHSLYTPDSGMYIAQRCFLLHGSLHLRAFQCAWQQVVDRHAALRTSFHWEKLDKALQVVHEEVKFPLEQYDWREVPSAEQQTRLEAFLESDRHTGFDLSRPPLIRLSLIQLSEDTYQIILSQHHLILDGWSSSWVMKEFVEFYEVLSRGQNKALVPSRSYGEYIAWLQQQDLFKAEVFWRQFLSGIKAPTPLIKISGDTFSSQEDSYDEQFLKLSTETTAALQSLAQLHHLTLNTLVQGAWAMLLSRYSGELDVVYGNTVSGRPGDLVGAESIVGMFVNTLPIRVKVNPEQSLVSWLNQLQAQLLEVRQHEYSPLVEIKRWSEMPKGMPLFESIFVFENYPVNQVIQEQELNLEVQSVRSVERTNYPLTVIVLPNQELELRISYQCNRFSKKTISRMLGHFHVLLQGMVINPEVPLKDLPLLTHAETHQLIRAWNNTQVEYPSSLCIHELFEAQANRSPDAVAVVFGSEQLTYQQLNQKANQLAHHLQSLGVGPEMLVGICLERSLEMVVGLLGILKAGGAYVPLDPAYPSERLAWVLSDSQASILLTQQHLLVEKLVDKLPQHQALVFCLDTDWKTIPLNGENLFSSATPKNLAYVIYTSGSTGKPKGVQITHSSVVNFLTSMAAQPGLTAQDTLLAVTSISFDIAALELYLPLIRGARLELASREVATDGRQLGARLHASGITVMQATPATWRMLLATGWQGNLHLKILCGGEALPRDLAEALLNNCGALWNLYGPTETTIWSTACKVDANKPAQAIVPIGHPIANTQIYLLDTYLKPVPIGVPGELYISGGGVARGYLNRPDLTAERFVPNPFVAVGSQKSPVGKPELGDRSQESGASSQEPGARKTHNKPSAAQNKQPIFYKTGDLARYLPDGTLEFLGRIDHQVKVRGFRIELGEIEATLGQHPAVRETVVLARADQPDQPRLVAYVVWENQAALASSELRQFLQKQLPEYMVPSAFVPLQRMPLTPNGKLDRQALPVPDTLHSENGSIFVAPRTEIEVLLADIWAQVLRLEKVGIHDNFFELGGDSILSIQIISRVNQTGLQLTLQQMFEHQTVAELAVVATTGRSIQADQGLVMGEVPLTPIQHWFLAQNLPEVHHWNQAILLEVRQVLEPVLLWQTVQRLLEHHDALRLRFEHQATGWQQYVSHPDAKIPLMLFDLSAVAEADQGLAIATAAAELQASLDLAAGPLMQVAYFELGANRSDRLLWVIHHLAVDGVSWRILLEDFQRVYEQLRQGQTIQLPPKTTSFQYWATKLQAYGQSDIRQQALDYWLQQARQPVTPLPIDFPGGANTVARACVVSTALSPVETQVLLQEVPKAYQTQINDVLLTALAQAFAGWTGTRCLHVDLEGHGREDLFTEVDLSRTVGWFTSLFPVLLDIGESDHPGTTLKAIKEQLRSIPQRGIGYGILRYLHPQAAAWPSQSPAEVMFNYLGQTEQGLQASSSLVAPAPEASGSSQSLQGNRSHLLSVSGLVTDGQLRLNWTYSEGLHQRITIETLAERCMAALRSLMTHCQSLEAGTEPLSEAQPANVAQPENVAQKERTQSIRRVPRSSYLPLSFAQARLWLLEQLASSRYNEPAAVRLEGALNVAALEQSFNEIVRRHEVFRTTFPVVDGQPRQWIAPSLEVALPIVNLCPLSAAEQERESQRLIEEWSQRTFNLAQDPLLRIALLKLSEQEHRLMFSTHHIIYDRWSMGLLIKELAVLYRAFCQGQPSSLPALPIQYADFAVWQSQWLQGEILEKQLAYWRQQLAGAPATLNLQKIAGHPPLETKQQTMERQSSAAHSFQLSMQLSEQLKALSRQQRVTLFMTLLSALQALLYRYTNQNDIVVGTDVAGRNRVEVEALIGFFINLLVLRTDLSGNPTFRELLNRVREVTLGAYAHQDLPFAKLVESLRPDRTQNTTPLFQVLFVLQNIPSSAVEFPELTITPVEVSKTQARFDLALFVMETEQGLFGNWRYRTDLFDPAAIARLSTHFQTLLHNIVQNPDARIDTIEMLSETEQQQQISQKIQRERAQFKKFKAIKPKAVNLPRKELVKTGHLQPGQSLPCLIQPNSNAIDLADWAKSKREFIETNLLKHGAILFRGFKANSVPEFEKVASAICPQLFGNYGDLPREGVSENVYGSTPYPADRAILFHNESSHLHQWPLKIWFFCMQPAQSGGETPIVDCRKVYQLLSPNLRERFEQKQLMYARNYIEGLDVSWQDFFHTSDKKAVESYCRQSGIDCEWLADSELRTYKIRPAISRHPKTGEPVFFNQVQLHHISCLETAVRTSLLSALQEDKLPRNVYYGDGSPIEDSVMAEISEVYEQAKISFPWERGDILMLDNMLAAHGRNPYVGPRKIVVAMGEMVDSRKVERI